MGEEESIGIPGFSYSFNLKLNNNNIEASTSSSWSSSSANAIDSSNVGFQLLKKHGWKEGSGLGVSEQGRLEPVETYFKKNKKGLGAENLKINTSSQSSKPRHSAHKPNTEKLSKKEKALSKRLRKMLDEEKRRQEQDFERAFYREFWPDNV